MISYQITSFNPSFGNISVLFKKDDVVIASYNVDVPLTYAGLFITGEELNNYLLRMFPQHVIDRKNKLEAGIPNAADIASLVVPIEETTTAQVTEISEQQQAWFEIENEKRVAKALVKFGLLATDPTEIPAATL